MSDYYSISTLNSAEDAAREGLLRRALLMPAELGGQEVAENIVYLTPHASQLKSQYTEELLIAVREGMIEIAIVPEYRGRSFVPAKIHITAARPGETPEYEREIEVW